ncbi:hypothetical protein [Ralstonia solanacearum]|uniref:hypothetical protein n=1 Tax=Ralstonia solanacearum TaxID=305 RepID=UPI000A6C876F|nr:hypothetical protein [Ralstonia solanacearum]
MAGYGASAWPAAPSVCGASRTTSCLIEQHRCCTARKPARLRDLKAREFAAYTTTGDYRAIVTDDAAEYCCAAEIEYR